MNGTATPCASGMAVEFPIRVGKKEVEVYVKLGFLLMALGPRIEHEINRFCDENFGPAE